MPSCGDDFLFRESISGPVRCSVNCTYGDQAKNYVVGSGPDSLTKVCVPGCAAAAAAGNVVVNDTARYCALCAADRKVSYGECISLSKSCPAEVKYVAQVGALKVCVSECPLSQPYWRASSYNTTDFWCVEECDTQFVDQEKQCVAKCSTPFFALAGDHYECQKTCDGVGGVDPDLDAGVLRCVQSCAEFSDRLPYLQGKTCVGRCDKGVYNDTTKQCLESIDNCAFYRQDKD